MTTTILVLRRIGRLLVIALTVLVPAACGGDGGSGTVTKVAGILTCSGKALAADPSLPAGFPRPGELTYVQSRQQGPTLVVNGYYRGGLEDAYRFYKDGFEGAGYDILFDEQEQSDAEVSYRDAAENTSGQVALRGQCGNGNVSVRITNRPA